MTTSQATDDQSSSYPQQSTTHPVKNETPDSYPEGATLSKVIYQGRPTTTKLTLVDLPYLTSYSTFHECTRGILYQPQYSSHSPLTRLGVTIAYSLRLEGKITSPLTSIIRGNTTTESTPTKLIYSTSRKTTTFQVGIHSSNFLTNST